MTDNATRREEAKLASLLSATSPSNRTVIIGAGIVGSILANILSIHPHSSDQQIVLIDRDVQGLPGSTGHAPGYVGQYNSVPALTELARRTVRYYLSIPGGFSTVGGLEIAQSPNGMSSLQNRGEEARKVGLRAEMVSGEQAVGLAPYFVKEDGVEGGLWFENDGTANAQLIARQQQKQARERGAVTIDAEVESVDKGKVVLADGTEIQAAKVVLCTGIWTRSLMPQVPIVPVAHPYAYTAERDGVREKETPFIRYPEAHVYVRDHGLRDGIGSYSHDPIAVVQSHLTSSAYGEWETSFQLVLQTALALLPAETRRAFEVDPVKAGSERVFNGLFSVTPDGKPLVGKVSEGVYMASAVWVTHAAASAQLVADVMMDNVQDGDKWLVQELDPHRFDGKDNNKLEADALGTYNDIYNKNQH